MSARVLGHATKAAQARRLEILRELWPTDRTTAMIGDRLGVSESHVSILARRAGLPPRARRGARREETA